MNYQDTLTYLYNSLPMFQQVGNTAYKAGLENTHKLDAYFGHPHQKFETIHIAGTNGKGSCSHTLAAILQSAGYKVGLYTSPHLVDFRERIRINGEMIPEQYVIDFVEQHRTFFEPLFPSFFELTTAMAFRYFADQQVDIAIIEVGLGGRLDCTNIITPKLCIITNISFDHIQYLGNTLPQIAYEKAGIIKPGIPVIIGETREETKEVFLRKAHETKAPIHFAEQEISQEETDRLFQKQELQGEYQKANTRTILCAIKQLQAQGLHIDKTHVTEGFTQVCEKTGFMGRWQKVNHHPDIICDAGHNVAGIACIGHQLLNLLHEKTYRHVHFIFGMVNDKDIDSVLKLLPHNFTYYFTKASVKRALNECELQQKASAYGLNGQSFPNVKEAVTAAIQKSLPQDLIFVGGSCFIVADLLANSNALNLH